MNKKNILISSIAVTLLTLFIKVLGVIKQSVIAYVCGATLESDMFFVATGIISQLSVALFSAISISLLTTFSKAKQEEGEEKANKIVSCAIKVFIPITAIIVLLINCLAYPIAYLLAPSYSQESLLVLATYIRILSIALVPSCLYLIINVPLENDKVFLPGKMQGFFLNLFIIIAAVFLYKPLGIISLVIAFLLSMITQVVFVAMIARKRFKFHFGKTDSFVYVKKILLLSLPLIIGNAAYEINDIVDKKIALSLGDGAASILNYGASINEIVTGIIVSSVSVVLFANFASWVAENKTDKLSEVLKNSLTYLFVLILPLMLICILSGDVIIKILYGRGKFSESDIGDIYYLTSGVVIGYAAGFIFQSVRAIVVKAYYAFNNTVLPTVTGVISVVLNIALSIILSKPLGVMGIALATSIGMAFSSFILLLFIKKILPSFRFRALLPETVKSLAAILLSGSAFWLLNRFTDYNVYLKFIVNCAALLVLYTAFLGLFRSETLKGLLKRLKRDRNGEENEKGIDNSSDL